MQTCRSHGLRRMKRRGRPPSSPRPTNTRLVQFVNERITRIIASDHSHRTHNGFPPQMLLHRAEYALILRVRSVVNHSKKNHPCGGGNNHRVRAKAAPARIRLRERLLCAAQLAAVRRALSRRPPRPATLPPTIPSPCSSPRLSRRD